MKVKSSSKISKSNISGGAKRNQKITSSQINVIKTTLEKFDTSSFLNNSQRNEIINNFSKADITPSKSFAEALKEYGFDAKQIDNLFNVIRGNGEFQKIETNNDLTNSTSAKKVSVNQNNNNEINDIVSSLDFLSSNIKKNLKSELKKISENKKISEAEKKDAFSEILNKILKKHNKEIRSGMIFSSYA